MTIEKTLTYTGQLSVGEFGESYDVLLLSNLDEPLAEELQEDISSEMVTVRYWITDKECTREEAQESAVRTQMGMAGCVYRALYSETTGYLWTDEEIKIGGHDLLEELSSFDGKWLILEVDIHDKIIH